MEKKFVTNNKFWKVHENVDKFLHEIIPQIASRATDDLIESNLKRLVIDMVIQERDALQAEMKSNPQDQDADPALWDVLKRKFEKSSASHTSCRDDAFCTQHHDDHQEDDAPPEGGEKSEKTEDIKKLKLCKRFSNQQAVMYLNINSNNKTGMLGLNHKLLMKMRIVEVVRITTDKQHGLDYMEQIIMMRENNKPDSFSKADFKYLNKNDIEYLYYPCLNKKVNHRENKLLNSLMKFIRSYSESSKSVNSSKLSQESKLNGKNTDSSKPIRPKSLQKPKLKCELYHYTNHSTNECYRILYCMKCKKEDHRTSDHDMYVVSLNSSKNYKAWPYQYASPSKQILKANAKPFPPCTYCGFNNHHPDDCRNYPECEICRSYDHFTSGHNCVIHVRGGVLVESSQSNESSIGASCTTCGSNVHSTTDHNDFEHCKRGEKIQATKVESSQREQPGPKVVFGDNSSCITEGYGSINYGGIVFTKVSFVNGLKYNLISISQLYDTKYIVQFDDKQGTIFNANKEIVLIAPRKNDVYVLDMSSLTPNGACLFAKGSESVNWLWHKRISHLNFKNINKLTKKNKVIGLHSLVYSKDKPCSTCEKGKHKRASFKTKQNFLIKLCLHLLHMDLFRPISLMSINHKKYTLVIVDEYSRYTWVRFLKKRIHATEMIMSFIRMVENQNDVKVKQIRTDNGTECLVFILNHKDNLGKFDAKDDEDDPSRQYQSNSDISYYIIPHGRSLTELIQGNHVHEVISLNEQDTPHNEDVKGPPNLINTKGTQEQNVHDKQINSQPTKEYLGNNTETSDRWSRDQHIELVNIIGDPGEGMLTRSMAAKLIVASTSECLFADFLSEIEPEKVYGALKHPGWVDAMQEVLNQNKKDEVGTIVRNKARLVTQGFSQEEGIDYDETFALVARIEAIRIFFAFATYINFIDLLKKYEISDSALVKTPMVPPNSLGPGLAGKPANLKESHLIAVKRIFRYLKGTSSLGLWYPKCLGFDLKGYSDSDYAGCNMDRKSISGACQLLGVSLKCPREFWCIAVVEDPKPPEDDSKVRPLKEFIIKFTVMNGKKPLTLDYKTFCESTRLDYNKGNYVSHPSLKAVKAKLAKVATNEALIQKNHVLKTSFPVAWRILLTFVVQVLGKNYSSTEQLNFIQQLLAYSLLTGTKVDLREIIFSDLVTRLTAKTSLESLVTPLPYFVKKWKKKSQTVMKTQPKSQCLEALGALPQKSKKPKSKTTSLSQATKIPPSEKGFHSPLDEGTRSSKPLCEGKPTDPKDWEGNKQLVDMRLPATHPDEGKTSFEVEPDTETLLLTIVADIQALLEDSEEELKDASDDDSPLPHKEQLESSKAKETDASDFESYSCSETFKPFDNYIPITERQLVRNLQNISEVMYAQVTEDNWENHKEAVASYSDLRAIVEGVDERAKLLKSFNRVSETLEADSSLKEADISSIKGMVTEMFQAFKGISSITSSVSTTIQTVTRPKVHATIGGGEFTKTVTKLAPELEIIGSLSRLQLTYTILKILIPQHESPQATPKPDRGKGIARDTNESPRKLMPASKEVRQDPNAPEEATKAGVDPKTLASKKGGQEFMKIHDTKIKVHSREHSKKIKKSRELRKKRIEQYR
ncbi:retrovirus-related pol polyprotein from transposon TNT 1-94 [Tanacetum coccineum]